MLPCVCSEIDLRGRQKFLPHFDVICDLLLNRRTQHGIYLLNRNTVLNQSARVFALGYFLKWTTNSIKTSLMAIQTGTQRTRAKEFDSLARVHCVAVN